MTDAWGNRLTQHADRDSSCHSIARTMAGKEGEEVGSEFSLLTAEAAEVDTRTTDPFAAAQLGEDMQIQYLQDATHRLGNPQLWSQSAAAAKLCGAASPKVKVELDKLSHLRLGWASVGQFPSCLLQDWRQRRALVLESGTCIVTEASRGLSSASLRGSIHSVAFTSMELLKGGEDQELTQECQKDLKDGREHARLCQLFRVAIPTSDYLSMHGCILKFAWHILRTTREVCT